jgi:choline dehydrogenase-like flavoprotein
MIYTRGQPQDYDSWAALGCKGWGWADLPPYFKRAEDNARGEDPFHGAGGPLHVSDLSYRNPAVEAVVEAAVQAGFRRNDDFNGETQEGVGPYQVFQKNGRRLNAARAYLQASPASNLAIVADCQARILFEGRRDAGVAYRCGAVEERLYVQREVTVCCGAFGSPAAADGVSSRAGRTPQGFRRRGRRRCARSRRQSARSLRLCRQHARQGPRPVRPRMAGAGERRGRTR